MARNITGTLSLSCSITHESENPFGDAQHIQAYRKSVSFTEGTAADQIDDTYAATASAAAATVSYDLAGVLSGIFGTTVNAGLLKGIILENEGTALGEDLAFGGNVANHISLEGTVEAGGFFSWYSPRGLILTAGSADIFQVDPGANTIPFKVVFLVAV